MSSRSSTATTTGRRFRGLTLSSITCRASAYLRPAAAVFSVSAERRRVRHRRLSEHPPTVRLPRRLHRVVRAATIGRPGAHRAGRQPHLDRHPWFQRARQAPKGSAERKFYVWSDTDRSSRRPASFSATRKKSNWTYDPWRPVLLARFFSHQPISPQQSGRRRRRHRRD